MPRLLLALLVPCVTHAAVFAASRATRPPSLLRARPVSMAGSDVAIEAAGLSDLEPVLNLTMYVFFGELGRDYGFNNNRAAAFAELEGEQRASLREIFADASAASFKATLDDEVVGFVTCSDGGVLTNLAVHPKARRRSIGTSLVQRLLEGVANGAAVTLEVDGDNQRAYELYASCGFATVVDDKSGTRYAVDWWRGRVR